MKKQPVKNFILIDNPEQMSWNQLIPLNVPARVDLTKTAVQEKFSGTDGEFFYLADSDGCKSKVKECYIAL